MKNEKLLKDDVKIIINGEVAKWRSSEINFALPLLFSTLTI
jgi:hypothetical protein